jgi:hypothetical protein
MIGARRLPVFSPAWIVLTVIVLQGCSALGPRRSPQEIARQAEAELLLETVASRNADMDAFKGIGSVRLEQPGQAPISGRLAWVARTPSKVRFVFLVSGHPVLVFAADGQEIYWVDPRAPEETYRKVRSSEGRLDRLVSMPLRTADLVALLAGRVPIVEHSEVMLDSNPESAHRVLVLKRWWAAVQKIYMDREDSSVQRIDFLERSGDLRYRVEFLQNQTVQGYTVPLRLRISDQKGAALTLSLDRYEIAEEPGAEVFRIEPPEKL